MILPGHPFYGIKVAILQSGKTDAQEWCLIKHPHQPGFNYRIPLRWLDNKIPSDQQLMSYQEKAIAFPFCQIQKLALFMQAKLANVISSSLNNDAVVGSAQQILIECKTDVKENDERNRSHMDESPSGEKGNDSVETFMGTNNSKQKEL